MPGPGATVCGRLKLEYTLDDLGAAATESFMFSGGTILTVEGPGLGAFLVTAASGALGSLAAATVALSMSSCALSAAVLSTGVSSSTS